MNGVLGLLGTLHKYASYANSCNQTNKSLLWKGLPCGDMCLSAKGTKSPFFSLGTMVLPGVRVKVA